MKKLIKREMIKTFLGYLHGDKRTIEFMIESGADVSAKNKAGLTVVDVAKKAGDKSIVKVIESALESGSTYRHRVPAKAKVV